MTLRDYNQNMSTLGRDRPMRNITGMNQGGAQGRPALMHNGIGGVWGGANAQGSAPNMANGAGGQYVQQWRAANRGGGARPHPGQSNAAQPTGATSGTTRPFNGQVAGMQGTSQSAFAGMSNPAVAGLGVRPANAAAAASTAKVVPAYYEDSTYDKVMGDARLQLQNTLAELLNRRSLQRLEYDGQVRDGKLGFNEDREAMNARLGSSGMYGGGVQATQNADISNKFQSWMGDLTKKNNLSTEDIAKQQQLIKQWFSNKKLAEQGIARQRWEALNPGSTPPKEKK